MHLHLWKKIISVQRCSAVAGDTLIERFWGGLVFSPFTSLLSLGEVWNSLGTASAGCSPVPGFACTQIPDLCAPCLGGALSKFAYCFSFSNVWALSWCCRLWKYCVVCGAAASTWERTVSAELKCCFLLGAIFVVFLLIKIWNTVRRVCILVSVVGEHPALSENNFQFTAL